jgi:hypothetical protein
MLGLGWPPSICHMLRRRAQSLYAIVTLELEMELVVRCRDGLGEFLIADDVESWGLRGNLNAACRHPLTLSK